MTLIEVPSRFVGFSPEHYARIGLAPHGGFARAMATSLNHILGRHLNVIPGMEVLPSEVRNTATEAALWRTRYRATPNGTTLVVQCHCFPTDSTNAQPYWYVKIDGSAAADVNGNTNQTHNNYCASGAGLLLDNMFTMRAEYTVTAGAKHTVELWTKNSCRVQGWYLYEKPRDTLTVGTDTVVDHSQIVPKGGIYDADVASMVSAAEAINQKMRGVHLAYNVVDPATPIGSSPAITTSYVNPWDATTAYSATSVGAVVPTQYRNGYINEAAGTDTIAMYCWAYGERTSGGGTITVSFWAKGGSNVATVSINGAAGIYESTTLVEGPAAGGDKIDVQVKKDAAGTAGFVYAFGAFPLIGT